MKARLPGCLDQHHSGLGHPETLASLHNVIIQIALLVGTKIAYLA
jgi:hypothetical protein